MERIITWNQVRQLLSNIGVELGIDRKSPTSPDGPYKDDEPQYMRHGSMTLRGQKHLLRDELETAPQRVSRHHGTVKLSREVVEEGFKKHKRGWNVQTSDLI
jgi:hypothetical protein